MNGSYPQFPQGLNSNVSWSLTARRKAAPFPGKTIGSGHRHPQRKPEIYLFLHVTQVNVGQATTEIARFARDDNS
jgi:hypothetical protein